VTLFVEGGRGSTQFVVVDSSGTVLHKAYADGFPKEGEVSYDRKRAAAQQVQHYLSVKYPGSWCTLAIRVCVLLGVTTKRLKIGPPWICMYMTEPHPLDLNLPHITFDTWVLNNSSLRVASPLGSMLHRAACCDGLLGLRDPW